MAPTQFPVWARAGGGIAGVASVAVRPGDAARPRSDTRFVPSRSLSVRARFPLRLRPNRPPCAARSTIDSRSPYQGPRRLIDTQLPPYLMITWSSSLTPKIMDASFIRSVNAMSSFDASGPPTGCVCTRT